MTIGEEATKIGGEERKEITVDEAALEAGAGFEAEVVFEGVSEVVEEVTAEDGEKNDIPWEGEVEKLFDQQANITLFVYILNTLN